MSRTDSSDSAAQQISEIAKILAAGVIRHRRRHLQAPAAKSPDEKVAKSARRRLEVSPATVLSVTKPVNGPESPQQGARV